MFRNRPNISGAIHIKGYEGGEQFNWRMKSCFCAARYVIISVSSEIFSDCKELCTRESKICYVIWDC